MPFITKSIRKSAVRDVRILAQLGQVQPDLLSPITLRDDNDQCVRTNLFAREQLVGTRTRLVAFVRSQVKALGERLSQCSTKCFVRKSWEAMPESLKQPLKSILEMIQMLSDRIDGYDADMDRLSKKEFPETSVLRQVHGIGPIVALAFVATIGDPKRFAKSRSVGAYLGLVPRLSQFGSSNPGLPISKFGDSFMRTLLVSSATRIMRPMGPDCELRDYGLRIAGRGGQQSKAKARIAVARKLAVLLRSLLAKGEVYEPMRNKVEPAA
ncbi:MAG: transposase [Planctomycetota bacterium]